MITDVQFSAGHNDFGALRDAVLAAEAEGFGTTWLLDHFDGAMVGGDRPMLECFTLAGALAAVTTSIGIGSLVANVANRHHHLLALAAATAHRISGGRFTVGLGAGAAPNTPWAREHHERGIHILPHLADRHSNVVRQIEVLRSIEPLPTPMPIIIGVNSEELATIAGRHADGVNIRLSSPHAARYLAAARAAADAAGRTTAFDCSGWAEHDDIASQEKAEDLGLDRLIISRLHALGR